jgi:hypothetical protein
MPAPISSTDCDDLRDLDLRDLRINVAECNKSGAASETGKSWELGSNGGKSEMWEVLSEGGTMYSMPSHARSLDTDRP